MANLRSPQRKRPWLHPVVFAAFLAPVVSAPSGRALVPLLAFCGIWAFLSVVRIENLKACFVRPLTGWILAVTALCIFSSFWADNPDRAIRVGLKFFGLAGVGLCLLFASERMSTRERDALIIAVTYGLSIGALLLSIGAAYGHVTAKPLWGTPEQHPLRTLSHAQSVLAVLWCMLFIYVFKDGRQAPKLMLVGASIVLIISFYFLEHGASNLALLTAIAVIAACAVFKRWFLAVFCATLALVLLSHPVLIETLLAFLKDVDAENLGEGPWPSQLHRLIMWDFVVERIKEMPFLGHGANASRGFPGSNEEVLWGIELMPLHPHNGALQVWLELGLVGALLAVCLPALFYRHFQKCSLVAIAAGVAGLCAYLTIWHLSYGIWQSWWQALAWIMVILSAALMRPQNQKPS